MSIKPFALERYFAEFEFTAKYLMSSSDCEPLPMRELLEMADTESKAMWENLKLAYTESLGLPELRSEIALMYDGIDAENVMVQGPEEGIYITMQTLLKSCDEIVTTFPGYQSLYEIANSKGCVVKRWEPDENNVFSVDELETLLSDKTKMLVTNFPHNPTGALLKRDEFEKVISLLGEKRIMLFSDEMYRFLEYDENDRLPSACEAYQDSITLCGMSKSFALPGLRLGWLIINNPDIFSKLQAYKDYTTICNSGPSEILSLIALRNWMEIVKRNIRIIIKNIQLMEEFSASYPDFIRWIPPKAGSIAFPEVFIKGGIEDYCRRLALETGIMLLPSSVYGYEKKRVRVGLGREAFGEGLKVLRSVTSTR
jgi:aspartate/methionine/tyrosine aminotransferase